jgi:hypothetical protein
MPFTLAPTRVVLCAVHTLAVFALFAGSIHAQNVLTVCSIEPSAAGFTTVQDAIDDAADGDIIQLLPSPVGYGSFIVNKTLHIMGPGHAPQTQGGLRAEVEDIEVSADGITVEGLYLKAIQQADGYHVADLTARGNRFYGPGRFFESSPQSVSLGSRNWQAINNVFAPELAPNSYPIVSTSNKDTAWTLLNNHIEMFWPFQRLVAGTMVDGIVAYNLIVGTESQRLGVFGPTATFHSNVFIYEGAPFNLADGCADCNIEHNVFYSTQGTFTDPSPLENNTVNLPPTFLDADSIPYFDSAADYTPAPGSPAIGAGLFGLNAGIGGDLTPFSYRGYPDNLPRLTSVSNLYHILPQGAPLEIEVEWSTESE